ncbi:probable Altered inheritance rate of mitochondria protein 29 [Saccharomycodes ludwigii]|uniref:Probable Altered inheritance rate of mitochondria protein 29 n=1 Tax=Saccharomycodes ludwigii TaxID=36035 RepID=A0A376B9B5_9ASCO|nr:hypothetical protein SCDLUD_003154 [Saccharomycodes ludwigii]KAH3900183.1 hypothetical protein SCDLUD_003154 [Saccharomycodes ludwigii]SSD61159.1 probable Altered inheritance rate of mitochondria protein 29 [Saccharomycodes ludwigii]
MSVSTSIDYDNNEPLLTTTTPLSSCTLTIRVIKSFPYRNVKNIILKEYNLDTKTPKQLYEDALKYIQTTAGFRPFRTVKYDTMKVYTHAHGSKTVNLVINFDHDNDPKWVLDVNEDNKKLVDYDIQNETEISLYVLNDYLAYKENPEEKW